jgi:cell division protease FtsH
MSETPGTPKRDTGGQRLPVRGLAVWLLLLALFLTMFQIVQQGQEKYVKISWRPDFEKLVEEGRIRKCEIVMEVAGVNQYIRGEMIDLQGQPRKFKVNTVVTEYVQRWLDEHAVDYEYKSQNPYLWQLVSGAIPFLIVLGLLYFLFVRQMRIAGRGAMNFGKSRARLLTRDRNKITFEDVAGIDEAKEEVHEIIEFLKDPKRFQKLGGRIPKGVLLVGPPGTGKTLLAKAIAGEAQVPFFSISGSDFVEMFVGVGASRVRDMFEQGKKNAPCIIFIDEIDAVGRSRFSGIGGGHDEREQTLNALLVEMDGFDTQEGVIIIAATNRPDVLDIALLRPGRFDRQIYVDLPALDGREAILKIHSKRVKLAPSADLRRVARGTPGFSGADLSNLVNEAALLAARRGADSVELQDLEEARDKVRWGRERRSRVLDEKEKELTAYHEAGHAIVLQLLDNTEPLHKVTIIPRGASLGSTMQLPEKDRYTESKSKLISMLTGLMGGRAAEELVFQDVTTGAQNDLKQATHIARMMVCEWGMSESLGPQSFGEREELLFLGREVSRTNEHSEQTAQKIDEEVNRLLRDAYQQAIELLRTHRDKLDIVARLLLEQETLDGREVEEIVKHGRLLSEVERAEAADAGPAGGKRAVARPAGAAREPVPTLVNGKVIPPLPSAPQAGAPA